MTIKVKNQKKPRKTTPKKIEVSQNTNSPNTILKFKITNLRTAAYPGPLEKSDYLKVKVGDLMTKGSGNTVYEVVQIQRDVFTEQNYNNVHQSLFQWGNCRDTRLKELIDEYKKNGNFGACWIAVKPIVRNAKRITKGRLIRFAEYDYPSYKYNGYRFVDLQDLINSRQSSVNYIDNQIDKLKNKRKVQAEIMKTLAEVSLARNPINSKIEVGKPALVVSTGTGEDEVPSIQKCDRCKNNAAEDPHSCPYAEEINGDYDTQCNCCSDCTYECCQDI